MPIYEYRCSSCRHEFELLVRSDTPLSCPQCGAPEPERLLSRVAPAGRSAALVSSARSAANREGHFSHYSRAERAKIPK